ncbi:MAG: NAD(P)H dehydrogenase (quinone) [Planctomycetota bacterium]|jgi:NAD(P)H dehydrogenase (quinone)
MSKKGSVLVCGASGVQGGAIVTQLLSAGYQVSAITRSSDKQKAFIERGIEAKLGELGNAASLKMACKGVDYFVLVLPLDRDKELFGSYANNVIDAIKSTDIKNLIVCTRSRVPEEVTDIPAMEAKREAEKRFSESGIVFISLRSTIYMDNTKIQWIRSYINEHSVFRYPLPVDLKVAWISADDEAGFVLGALEKTELAGRIFDIGGPKAVTGIEIAQGFSSALGREIKFESITPAAFGAQIARFLGEETAPALDKNYSYIANHPENWGRLSEEVTTLLYQPKDDFKSWVSRQIPHVFQKVYSKL